MRELFESELAFISGGVGDTGNDNGSGNDGNGDCSGGDGGSCGSGSGDK